jgi:hypothetical protein
MEIMKTGQDAGDFVGKEIISVGDDQVFDLGDEDDISRITDADSASWESDDDFADEDDFLNEEEESDEEEIGVDVELSELAQDAEELIENLANEDEEEEDFMASLDEISIDLHDEDPGEGGQEPGEGGQDPGEGGLEDFALPEGVEIPEEEGPGDANVDHEFEGESPASELPEPEEEAVEPPQVEPGIDEREALGLVPRLSDDDIAKFEHMVIEAKTLQQYIEELDGHESEIKTKIYYKLLREYSNRKAEIFQEPEFISVRIDVEQDLDDMVRKRDEFQATIANLHDELEEVQVRHLVGEYSDDELAEREQSRKVEMGEWQDKSERLESFITRYQELLETEKALNPIEEEPEEDVEDAAQEEETELLSEQDSDGILSEQELGLDTEEPADEAVLPEEASVPEEAFISDESGFDNEEGEEPETAEEEMPEEEEEETADVDLPEELENIGDLSDILGSDDEADWEDDTDVELTAEGIVDDGFTDDDDFTLDDDFSLDDDLAGLEEDEEDTGGEDEVIAQEADMIACKKCGRSTPASEKFCVNCGAKAQ